MKKEEWPRSKRFFSQEKWYHKHHGNILSRETRLIKSAEHDFHIAHLIQAVKQLTPLKARSPKRKIGF